MNYATIDQADAWLAGDPIRFATWDGLTDAQKTQYLTAATRRLDQVYWPGRKTDATQEHAWPRTGVDCNGVAIADDAIPVDLVNATATLAGDVALNTSVLRSSGGENRKRVQAGSAVIEYFRQTDPDFSLAKTAPDAFALIRCLLGTSSASSFKATGTRQYVDESEADLNEGYA